MGFFGARRDPKQSARDAIVTLRQQLQMLEKKEEYLQKKSDEELKKAKANAVTNKAGAYILLEVCHLATYVSVSLCFCRRYPFTMRNLGATLYGQYSSILHAQRNIRDEMIDQLQLLLLNGRRCSRQSWNG